MKNYFKNLNNRKLTAGFTLAELLIGSYISTVVVGTLGYGLFMMMNANKTASAQSERRIELNRALDFISDEIRQAEKIEPDGSSALASAPDFTLPSGARPVLVLKIANTSQRVIYYTSPADFPWLGPNLIRRWGPDLDLDGRYINAGAPQNWNHEPLIDLIEDTVSTPNCLPGWSANPSSGATGFYACVDPTGDMAEVHANGRVNKADGNSESYEVSAVTTTRAEQISSDDGGSFPPFTISGGLLTVNEPVTLRFEVLGGAITCDGTSIPVTTKLFINGSTQGVDLSSDQPLILPSGSVNTVMVQSTAQANGFCDNYQMTVDSTDIEPQAYALVNGDTPPSYLPYDNQAAIEDFLEGYLEDGKVKIADNQTIFLYELGTTDTGDAAFDVQDNVVLVTVDNP